MLETELILFDGAKNMLRQMGITPKMSELNKVRDDIAGLQERVSELEREYKTKSKEKRNLEQKMKNLNSYLGLDHTPGDDQPDRDQTRKTRQAME